MSEPRTVVVCAPQGAGKTKYAEALRAMFGCSSIVDDWDGESPLPAGALALTNSMPVQCAARDGYAPDAPVRRVRPPYSREFIDCTCGARDKDDCLCIRAYLDRRDAAADPRREASDR
jgi:hypothetical protein